MKYSVRAVQLSDEAVIMQLGREVLAASAFRGVTFSPSHVADVLKQCIDMPKQNFGVVCECDGEVIGFMCAYATLFFFSTDIVCHDHVTYITPSARAVEPVTMMVSEYKKWAESVGALRAYLGSAAVPDDMRIGMLFNKLGFRHAGTLHVMEIGHGR